MRWFESSRPSRVRASHEPAAVLVTSLATVLACFERGDVTDALPAFSEHCVYREPGKEPVIGRTALAAHWNAFVASGVRWRFFVDGIIAEGRRACVIYRFGVARGEADAWRERAGCAVVQFDAHDTIEEWREYDG